MVSINRISLKIFISMFLSILFFSVIFSIYYVKNQKKEIIDSMQLEAKSIAKMIVYVTSDAIVLNDGAYIVEFNHEFLSQHELLKSIIISKNSNEYFIIKKDKWLFEKSIDSSFTKLEGDTARAKIMKSKVLDEMVFHYTYPIVFSATNWGHIHLSFSLEQYNKRITSMYVSFSLFFIVLLFITSLVSYFIAKSFSKPIIKLNEIANEISHGNLQVRSDYKSKDEFGQLSNSFNKMISKIQSSQEQLKESHEELENRVEIRTLELNETNKKLEEKTIELEYLNKQLDKKVKDEVEKRTDQERLLIQQSRLAAMGEMIGNIAHQWRQPLSIITTAASGIKVEKEFGISSEKEELNKVETIMKTSIYLSNTIEDFSNFFKPNKEKENFNIETMLKQSLELVGASFKYYHISVNIDVEKEIIVNGFANEYAQAIMNILNNAKDILVDRNIQNPTIDLKIYEKNGLGVLAIKDNAGGIDNNIIDKIFEPYFTTKHKSQGTGIGLYMSKMIIEENMQGELKVENSKDGAVFTISVPNI